MHTFHNVNLKWGTSCLYGPYLHTYVAQWSWHWQLKPEIGSTYMCRLDLLHFNIKNWDINWRANETLSGVHKFEKSYMVVREA